AVRLVGVAVEDEQGPSRYHGGWPAMVGRAATAPGGHGHVGEGVRSVDAGGLDNGGDVAHAAEVVEVVAGTVEVLGEGLQHRNCHAIEPDGGVDRRTGSAPVQVGGSDAGVAVGGYAGQCRGVARDHFTGVLDAVVVVVLVV